MKKLKKVIWHDIAAITPDDDAGSWMSQEYIESTADALYKRQYTTVGRIIVNEKDYIVIAATSDDEDETYSDVSMIPKSVIIKITTLK